MISNKQPVLLEKQRFDYSDQFDENDLVVVNYLRSSPDFFKRNAQLLMEIEVPHHERGAVSLVEKRMALHREQNEDLRERLSEIIEVAHRNDHLADLLHDYSMALISADSIGEVLEMTSDTLASRLNCSESKTVITKNDVISLCLDDTSRDVVVVESGMFESLAGMNTRKNVYCGPITQEKRAELFPSTTLDIQSVAVIRLQSEILALGRTVEIGYLALASDDKHRFAPHMGTDFLRRFGELLSARLAVFYG